MTAMRGAQLLRAARGAPVLCLALLGCGLLGCGRGSSDNSASMTTPPTAPVMGPSRGQLTTTPARVGSYTTSQLLTQLGVDTLGKELLSLSYSPTCSVDVYQIQYATVGGMGEATTASGALMVPTGSDSSCQGPRPVLLYAHGTTANKDFNIANITTSDNSEGLILAAIFAAKGYIVVASNYAGYDTSTLPYHPYLNADQQSKDMIDALAAATSALPLSTATSVVSNGKLFITGYSQGGYVAMATHRAMQAAGMKVTASAPMSGPYALSAFGDAIFMGEVSGRAPLNVSLIIESYQHSYGNVYKAATDVFEAPYAPGIESLLPTTVGASALYSSGKLPQDQLFSSTPPSPDYASMTPATTPANLAPVFAIGFGTNNLITNSYRLSYLQDAQASPDGGFPTTTNDLPPPMPANGFRQDLKTNDLRNWSPAAPMLVCAGDSDPTVLYLNTQLMQGYWAMNPTTSTVTFLDVDANGGGPYSDLQTGFAAAKAAVAASAVVDGATDGGVAAVFQAYHAGLVPPFCLTAAKRFFDSQ
jgi:hypothetical protein